jgi:hypothetical protein
VHEALRGLNQKELAGPADNMESRVKKYEHRLQEAFNFTRHEIAILCELLLRGPQTPGELRGRAERLHSFDDLGIVQSTLQRLMKREPPLVKLLPRRPGTKEARYTHLLCGELESWRREPDAEPVVVSGSSMGNQMARLESEIATLQREVADLKQQFADFRKQFD